MSRVFLIVADSFGIGEAKDAKKFGDEKSNTFKSVFSSKFCKIPTLTKLGLLNIDGVSEKINIKNGKNSVLVRLEEESNAKDSTTGHWEMAGIVTKKPFPTYPNGFSDEIINKLKELWNVDEILCNKPYSGTEVIKDYGEKHLETGYPIVYTSADSVLQIAVHEDIISVEKLYEMCTKARKLMTGKNNISRVIARPFIGEYPNFTRTSNRKDFSVDPPKNQMLQVIQQNGKKTISLGKISDLFNDKNIDRSIPTKNNDNAYELLGKLQKEDFDGLAWLNLCDFDSKYGHRNDIDGYAKALAKFDKFLKGFIKNLKLDDLLIITADHGCDPATPSTDHSREDVPCIVYGKNIKQANLGTKKGFYHVGATVLDKLQIKTNISTLKYEYSLLNIQ